MRLLYYLALQHTAKAFRLVQSNGERLLSILIFESLLNVDTAGYLLPRKTAVMRMLSKKQQNKHTSITSTSEKTTEAYK